MDWPGILLRNDHRARISSTVFTALAPSSVTFRGDLKLRAVIDRRVNITDRHLDPLHYGLRLENPRLCSGLIDVVDDADRHGNLSGGLEQLNRGLSIASICSN
jgi:hypothetical protein